MTYDPFRGESGLLDNTDLVVRDAIFTNRLDAFEPTKLELHLTVDVAGEDGGEQVIYLGCGDGWETLDDGRTATRTDNKDRNFHQSTRIWAFFGGLVKVMGDNPAANKAVRARAEEFPLGPRDAEFWKGLNVHVEREGRKGGGDIGDYEVLVVDAFNGYEGDAAGKATGSAKKAAPAKKAAKKAAAAPAKSGGLTDDIRAQLDAIADASADHDAFMEAAIAAVPEATSDDEVKAAVADDTSEDGIWKQAVARYEASVG